MIFHCIYIKSDSPARPDCDLQSVKKIIYIQYNIYLTRMLELYNIIIYDVLWNIFINENESPPFRCATWNWSRRCLLNTTISDRKATQNPEHRRMVFPRCKSYTYEWLREGMGKRGYYRESNHSPLVHLQMERKKSALIKAIILFYCFGFRFVSFWRDGGHASTSAIWFFFSKLIMPYDYCYY